MNYVNLGNSGLKVSRIGLGMMTFGDAAWRPWILGLDDARPIFRRAAELGINFFDTADMYSAGASEEITGRLVREFCNRDEVVVATKFHHPVDMAFSSGQPVGKPKPPVRPNMSGQSRKRIFAAVDSSLTRLGLDYIDLYQPHRFDPSTPMDEVMEALHDVVKAGKVRYIGASSMWAWQFAKMQFIARERGWTRFVSMQNHYNLAYREEEREMIPFCRDQGVGLIPWSPLARGFLAGTRKRGEKTAETSRGSTDELLQAYYGQDADFDVLEALSAVAGQRGVKNAEVAYAWLLSRPGVTAPIVGASKVWQIEDAVKALDITLSAGERDALESPYRPHRVIGHA